MSTTPGIQNLDDASEEVKRAVSTQRKWSGKLKDTAIEWRLTENGMFELCDHTMGAYLSFSMPGVVLLRDLLNRILPVERKD